MEAPRLTQTTITILLNEEWLTTEQVMHALGKSQLSVQKLAQAGLLKWILVTRVGTSPGRVYDAKDVRALVPVVPMFLLFVVFCVCFVFLVFVLFCVFV